MPIVALAALWASLAAGVAALLYVFSAGFARLVRRRAWRGDPLRVPWLGIVALAVPVPLFARQSLLQLGDPTLASVALALVTMLLPLALVAGLVVALRRRRERHARLDAIALLAALQWLIVLAAWGLMPVRLWAW